VETRATATNSELKLRRDIIPLGSSMQGNAEALNDLSTTPWRMRARRRAVSPTGLRHHLHQSSLLHAIASVAKRLAESIRLIPTVCPRCSGQSPSTIPFSAGPNLRLCA